MAGLAAAVRGQVVWNVNSTAGGGGVAELLGSLIPYDRGAGVDEQWVVVDGTPSFFSTTKKLHVLLHGLAVDGTLDDSDRRRYDEATSRNATALAQLMHRGDVAILHDPQTAGLIPTLSSRGVHVIWRAHIGVNQPNDNVRSAWSFLSPYLATAEAYVFSRKAFAWDGLDEARVHIIAPCIDPFATKNRDLTAEETHEIPHASGLFQGGAASSLVTRTAQLEGAAIPEDARVVVQVSRWDRLKDPAGVMDSFAAEVAPRTDAWLMLAGPAPTSVQDDPEQPGILRELSEQRQAMPAPARDRVVLAQLPMDDLDENARMVNALQRRANVVMQKSLAEGFGLTVAEAMWKSRPVVASRVGGIEDQIEDGKSGLLIDDPHDLVAFGAAVADLLNDPTRARKLGDEAHSRIARKFISPRHLIEQAQLIRTVLAD